MSSLRQKLLSQNFLHNRKLVTRLVGRSSIGKKDLVLEIGPGRGIITRVLLEQAGHVVAVELDAGLYQDLRQTFARQENLTLCHGDILSFPLSRLPYKVFANIPFAIEGKIIRKLLEDDNPPQDCFLVVMRELALRLANEQGAGLFGARHRPWFEFTVEHAFKRSDFTPAPNVDAVLLRIQRKKLPLLPFQERKKYWQFVRRAFGHGLPVKNNLKHFYGPDKVAAALHQLSLSRKIRPGELTPEQWVKFYAKTQPYRSFKRVYN